MKTILLAVLVTLALAGCGSNLDGSFTYANGTVHGNVTGVVDTPLGVFTPPAISFDEAGYSPDQVGADVRPSPSP